MSFIPNPGILQALEEETKGGRHEIAQQVAETAKETAPVETGEYRDSITAVDDKVVTTSDHGVFVELGTYKDPAQHILRRALDENGLKDG